MFEQLTSLARTLTISQRIGIVFGALFSVLLLVGMVMWAGQPQMLVAFSGMDPTTAGTVSTSLDAAGIPYDLTDNGATIKVPADQVAKARIAATTAGYSSDGTVGWKIFDSPGFGQDSFTQQVSYQRAVQDELKGEIQKIRGVSEASVTVVPAKVGTLVTQDQSASASIWLRMSDGGAPGREQVDGIVALAAGAVAGLTPDNVTVVDSSGTTLHGPGTVGSDAMVIQNTIERDLANKVTAMLNLALGPGNAQVAVTADLDLDKVTQQVTQYTTDQNTPTSAQNSVEVVGNGSGAGAGGIAGTTSNIPGLNYYPNASASASPGPSASTSPDYLKQTTTVNWANSQTVSQVIKQPGTIKRLSVSVLLNKTTLDAAGVKPGDWQASIEAVIGKVADRGDVVQLAAVAFAVPTKIETPMDIAGAASSIVPTVAGLLLGLILLFLVWRNMRGLRRRAEEMQMVTARMGMPALSPGAEMAMAGMGGMRGFGEIPELAAPPSATQRAQEHIRLMADEKPEELASLMNTWLREDEKKRR
ncbi:MAG: flagellar basal-body MS-ring/collar protein FliF [Chloroflexota bacterium]